MTQTAVEWLVEQLIELEYDLRLIPNHIKQAKEMEKERIGQAYMAGLIDGMNSSPKEYYNETYNNES